MRGAIVKQKGSSKNHILTHSKHGNCSLHWQRKADPWAKLREAQGLRQRHRLRSPLYAQEDCRSDCCVKVSQLAALREDRKLSFIMTCGRLAVKARCDQPGGLLS